MISADGQRFVPLSPLARGTTGGVPRTSEDPLPQKTRRPPWKRGTNVNYREAGGTPALPWVFRSSIFEGSAQFASPNSSIPPILNEPEWELEE